MDWTHTLTIIGTLGAFVMYISSRADRRSDALESKIESSSKSLNDKIESLQKDLNHIGSKVSNIEGQITQMTRPSIIPISRHPEEDIKES